MKRSTSNLIIFSVIGVVIVLGIWGYFLQKGTNKVLLPKINNEVVFEYEDLLKNDNYKKAYNDLTSESFKEKYSLDDFLSKQLENEKKYGELDSIAPLSGIVIKEKEMEGTWKYFVTMGYYGKKDSKRIIMEFVSKENKFKLNNTYVSTVTIKNKKPEIF